MLYTAQDEAHNKAYAGTKQSPQQSLSTLCNKERRPLHSCPAVHVLHRTYEPQEVVGGLWRFLGEQLQIDRAKLRLNANARSSCILYSVILGKHKQRGCGCEVAVYYVMRVAHNNNNNHNYNKQHDASLVVFNLNNR